MKGLIIEDLGGRLAEGNEYIRNRIERLVFIPEDSILGYPDWGSRIPSEFLQEPEDETTADEIINEMSFLFQSREPEIFLDSVSVNILGMDSGSNGLVVQLNVYEPQATEVENIEFFKIVEVT
jgi:hypothetical protein